MGNSEFEADRSELSPAPLFDLVYNLLHKLFPESYPEIQNTVNFLAIEEG
jgi:hypothetical protein